MKDDLINQLDDVVYVSDIETYELLYLNKRGISESIIKDYKGKKCYEVLQGRHAPCEFCSNCHLKEDKFYIWEFANEFRKRHYILKDKLIEYDGRLCRFEIAIDITEKENISKENREKLELEEILVECVRKLAVEDEFSEALNFVLEKIGSFHQADRAYIFEIRYDYNNVRNTYEWCDTNIEPQREKLQNITVDEITNWLYLFEKEKEVLIENVEELKEKDPIEYRILMPQKITSLMAVPLMIDKNIVGFIGVDNPKKMVFNTSLLNSLAYFLTAEKKKRDMTDQLDYMSFHDALTGVCNRNKYIYYMNHIEKNLIKSIGVAFLDINGMKKINDTQGHESGDMAIIETSSILKKYFRCNDIFRIGGDEFTIVCENIEKPLFYAKLGGVQEDFSKLKDFSVSIGYTWKDEDMELDCLMNEADRQMYEAKRIFYEKEYKDQENGRRLIQKEKIMDESRMEMEMEKALNQGQFQVLLQPVYEIKSGKVAGAEALLRWNHPKEGVLYPEDFLQLFEKNGFTMKTDFFVLHQVCQALRTLLDHGKNPVPVSLNLSKINLSYREFLQEMVNAMEKYQVDHHFIELELEENLFIENADQVMDALKHFKKENFLCSIDKFGNRYSSLAVLRKMPVDKLKFDSSLLKDKQGRNKTVLKHAAAIARELGMQVTAVGIETKEDNDFIKSISCDLVQGYFYKPPISIEEFMNLLDRN